MRSPTKTALRLATALDCECGGVQRIQLDAASLKGRPTCRSRSLARTPRPSTICRAAGRFKPSFTTLTRDLPALVKEATNAHSPHRGRTDSCAEHRADAE